MLRRRTLAIVGLGILLNTTPPAIGQQTGKVWRIGFLSTYPRARNGSVPGAFRATLEELGYTEGNNIAYESRWAEARPERLPELVAELIVVKVDLVLTLGAPAAAAAKQAFSVIPIVAIGAGDFVETGLVTSLAHPGGNLTGVNDPAAVLSTKRLQLLKEVLPRVTRVAVLWNAEDPAMTFRYNEIKRAAEALRLEIQPLEVRDSRDFDISLAAMSGGHAEALMLVSDSLTDSNRQRVIDYAVVNQIPAMYELSNLVHSGGLMSYGAEFNEVAKTAGELVGRILKGAKAGDLPVQQPNRYVLVINQKVAKTLGLVVPQSLLLMADEVIQ
jgi:putative ABC transport system substrate-binding protein